MTNCVVLIAYLKLASTIVASIKKAEKKESENRVKTTISTIKQIWKGMRTLRNKQTPQNYFDTYIHTCIKCN